MVRVFVHTDDGSCRKLVMEQWNSRALVPDEYAKMQHIKCFKK